MLHEGNVIKQQIHMEKNMEHCAHAILGIIPVHLIIWRCVFFS